MKLLIVGASGLVGSHIYQEAVRLGHDVVGTYRNHPVGGMRRLDLEDAEASVALLRELRPDWVVHAAGWTWVDGCENDPDRAMRENCEQPAALALACAAQGCRMVYVSTSYVFDGESGPYRETDRPNPINVYAKSKWVAEQRVQECLGDQALIPRVICVWGREAQRKNFVYQVLKAVKEGRPLRIPSDQEGNPTWAGDIAAWLLELMQAGESGIWHLASNGERATREDWLKNILRGVRDAPVWKPLVENWSYSTFPTSEQVQPARRPLRAGMLVSRLNARHPRRTRAPWQINDVIGLDTVGTE